MQTQTHSNAKAEPAKAETKADLTYIGVLKDAESIERGYNTRTANMANHLMQLASSCKSENGLEQFLAGCEHAETQRELAILQKAVAEGWTADRRSDEEKLPTNWVQVKSDIKAVFERKHPSEFETYSQLRKWKDAEAKKKRDADKGPELTVVDSAGHTGERGPDKAKVKEQDKALTNALALMDQAFHHAKTRDNLDILSKMTAWILAQSKEKQDEIIMELQSVLESQGFTTVPEPQNASAAAVVEAVEGEAEEVTDEDIAALEEAQRNQRKEVH